jgi:hypothetical protein
VPTSESKFQIPAIETIVETDDRQKARIACTIGTQPFMPAV